jgi:hypothetical protein
MKRSELFAWRLGKYAGQARRALTNSQYEFRVALEKSPENLELLTKTALGRELELLNIVEAAQQFSATQGIRIEQIPREKYIYSMLMKRGGLTPEDIRTQSALREKQAAVLEQNLDICRSKLKEVAPTALLFFEMAYRGFSWVCEEVPHETLNQLGKSYSYALEAGLPFLESLEQRRSVESIDMSLNQWDKAIEELLLAKEAS